MSSFVFDFVNHKLYHLAKSVVTQHQRILLVSLIVIIELFSILLTSYAIYLTTLFYVPKTDTTSHKDSNSSNVFNWIGLSVTGFWLMTVCLIGLRGAQIVNLNLLLTFFWGIMIFIAPLILGIVVGFDFYTYLDIYFKHDWSTRSFEGVRKLFCRPTSSASTLCQVPYQDYTPYSNINSWCLGNFNSTDCSEIYNDAFNHAIGFAQRVILAQNITSIVNLFIIFLTIFICARMLTAPVITESMNDIINYLLVLPITGAFVMSWYLWNWQYYDGVPYYWSPQLYLALALCQLCALPLGVVAGRRKSRALLNAYVVFVLLTGAGLAVLGTFGLIYSGLFKSSTLSLPVSVLADVACDKQLTGCCCCDSNATYVDEYKGGNRCPEWSRREIYAFMGLDLKLAGATALLSILFLIGAIVVALLVRISLKNYKSDYI